jgi:hypothetical protein
MCSVCRGEEVKEREFLWAFFFFVVVMAALMMAASQAVGVWLVLNVDRPQYLVKYEWGLK